MAVPTVQDEKTAKPGEGRGTALSWVEAFKPIGRSLVAVLLAIIAGGLVIILTSPGPLDVRFQHAIDGYLALLDGAFGSPQNFSSALVKASPLIFTGLSVAIAYRAGLFNIGAAGQMTVGATAAAIVSFSFPTLSPWILIPLMLLSAIFFSGLWGAIAGFLKAWRGAHEVVTTIMLNWIAFKITDYLISGPYKAPQQSAQTSALPVNGQLSGLIPFYNNTLGNLFGKIANPEMYLVDVGLLFALVALLVYWFLIKRTTFGYEINVVGKNPQAARYAGISAGRTQIWVMALAGLFAGLAGALRVMGQYPYTLIGAGASASDPIGFDGIGVAMLGQTTALGILLSALLFGGLRWGSTMMQIQAGIAGDLVYILQALILISVTIQFYPMIQRWFKPRSQNVVAPVQTIPETEIPQEVTAATIAQTPPPPEPIEADEQVSDKEEHL
jgi:simple sugar transport system permease protein